MFVYLNKKIAVPNENLLTTLSWCKSKGYIACGGEKGLLKVLKLEPENDGHNRGIAAPTNLTMNENLQDHLGNITKIIWNEKYEKMTTADDSGLIIVWIIHKSQWHQEMKNASNQSKVNGMKWSPLGDKICIGYQDGGIIVGSVDGSRLWGKTVNFRLSHVEWSPDSRIILFGVENTGDVKIFDCGGNHLADITNFCNKSEESKGAEKPVIVAIEWYDGEKGYIAKNCPCLAICYDNGLCQIMKNESDQKPVIIDAGFMPKSVCWNRDGTVLAIGGVLTSGSKESNLIKFYDCFGFNIRTIKIPGKPLRECSWDGTSLRLAVAIDNSIYFASIRPNYIWAYCPDTLIFGRLRSGRCYHSVTFWNIKSEIKYTKSFGKLNGIVSSGNLCCIIYQLDNESNKTLLQVCNSIGTPIDSLELPSNFMPEYFTMTHNLMIVASTNIILLWQFKKPENLLAINSQVKKSAEIYRHIDDSTNHSPSDKDLTMSKLITRPTNDPICCICTNNVQGSSTGGNSLLVARDSGIVIEFVLPTMEVQNGKRSLKSRPFKMELNCDASRLAIIDQTGILSFYELSSRGTDNEIVPCCQLVDNFEYKDVWNMKFSEEDPKMFVMLEKSKLRIIHDLKSEDPIVFSGYLCVFQDLEVTGVLLDEIMMGQDDTSQEISTEAVVTLEAKILRDCRALLDDDKFDAAQTLVEDNPHNKMWKMLAEYSLDKLDLDRAEQAFVRYTYYPGIKFIKKIQKIPNKTLKMAEVSMYFGRYEEARQRLSSIDRPDLIIQMLKSIGDWNQVLRLRKKEGSGSDAEMNESWNAIGNQLFDKHLWTEAIGYFTQGRCYEKLVECYYYLEDYSGLENLSESLPENSILLLEIAEIFKNAGMCDKAVYAYRKNDQVKKAIDCCIQLNNWQTAIELARTTDMSDISGLLTRYAKQLLNNKCYVQAVELYRRAGCYLEAAKIVQKLLDDESKKSKNYLKLKKMSVLVGLLIEQHYEQNKMQAKAKMKDGKGTEAASALSSILDDKATGSGDLEDPSSAAMTSRLLDRPWHFAEAYHYYMLAQRHLYNRFFDAAMKTALLLTSSNNYEDVLPAKDMYSLLALCAIHNRAFRTLAKAFGKLETLKSFTPNDKENLIDLIFDIFSKYPPVNPERAVEYDIDDLYDGDTKYPMCIVSGQRIDQVQFWMCLTCKHSALEEEICRLRNCPLCHTPA